MIDNMLKNIGYTEKDFNRIAYKQAKLESTTPIASYGVCEANQIKKYE